GWGLVHDPARQTIYFTDLTQVWAVDRTGRARVVVPRVHTHELRIDARGVLHGEDVQAQGNGARARHWQWTPDAPAARFTPWVDGWRAETGFVADSAGRLYRAVCDVPTDRCAVRRYDRSGRATTMTGADRFARPLNVLTATPRGAILLADGPHIVRVTEQGPHSVFRNVTRATDRFAIMGLHALADGAIIAAAAGDRLVLRLAPDGARQVLWRSTDGWSPSAALLVDGRLWVTEYDDRARCRLVLVEPNGRSRVIPT
nr:hypothetical protein [Gemmatimonadaceae bacterium]